jgi:Family of unknown function (DUF6084)
VTNLTVDVLGARPSPHTAAPAVTLRLRIEELGGGRVHAIALRCQTRIEPRGRRYTKDEQARLYELFGDVSQWDRTLRSVTWIHSSLVVPSFERRIDVDFPIPCTYDLEVASAKYFHALRDGDIPLVLLFSGTIFNVAEHGLCAEPVPWDLECSYRMPATVWRAAMDQFFPGGGWLRLQQDTIDRLQAFRGRHAVITWDEAIDLLLQHTAEEEPA